MTESRSDKNTGQTGPTTPFDYAGLAAALANPKETPKQVTTPPANTPPARVHRPLAAFEEHPAVKISPPPPGLEVLKPTPRIVPDAHGNEVAVTTAADRIAAGFRNQIKHRDELEQQRARKEDEREENKRVKLERMATQYANSLVKRRRSSEPKVLREPLAEAFEHVARPTMVMANKGLVGGRLISLERAWDWTVNAADKRRDLVKIADNVSNKVTDPDARSLAYFAIEHAAQKRVNTAVEAAYNNGKTALDNSGTEIVMPRATITKIFYTNPALEDLLRKEETPNANPKSLLAVYAKELTTIPTLPTYQEAVDAHDYNSIQRAINAISVDGNLIETNIAAFCDRHHIPKADRPAVIADLIKCFKKAEVKSEDSKTPDLEAVRENNQQLLADSAQQLVDVVHEISTDHPKDDALQHLINLGNPLKRLTGQPTRQKAKAVTLERVLGEGEDGFCNFIGGTEIFGGIRYLATFNIHTQPRDGDLDPLYRTLKSKLTGDLAPLKTALEDEIVVSDTRTNSDNGPVRNIGLNLWSKAMFKFLTQIAPDDNDKLNQQISIAQNPDAGIQLAQTLEFNLEAARQRANMDTDELMLFAGQTVAQAVWQRPIPGIDPVLPSIFATHAGNTVAANMLLSFKREADQKPAQGSITYGQAGDAIGRLGDGLLKLVALDVLAHASKPIKKEQLKITGKHLLEKGTFRDLAVSTVCNPEVQRNDRALTEETLHVGAALTRVAQAVRPKSEELAAVRQSRQPQQYRTTAPKMEEFINPPHTVYDMNDAEIVAADMLLPLPSNPDLIPTGGYTVKLQNLESTPGPLAAVRNPAFLSTGHRYAPEITQTGLDLKEYEPLSREEAAAGMAALIIGTALFGQKRYDEALKEASNEAKEWETMGDNSSKVRVQEGDSFSATQVTEAAATASTSLKDAIEPVKMFNDYAIQAEAWSRALCNMVQLDVTADADSGTITITNLVDRDIESKDIERDFRVAITSLAIKETDPHSIRSMLEHIRTSIGKLGAVNAIAQEFAINGKGRSIYGHKPAALSDLAATIKNIHENVTQP